MHFSVSGCGEFQEEKAGSDSKYPRAFYSPVSLFLFWLPYLGLLNACFSVILFETLSNCAVKEKVLCVLTYIVKTVVSFAQKL
jgi:hypothetical protein